MSHLTSRHFAFASAILALSLLASISTAAAAEPAPAAMPGPADPYAHVDADLRAGLELFSKSYPEEWSEKTLAGKRKPEADFKPATLAEPPYVERKIPGPPGSPDVRIYVIGAKPPGAARPAVLHIHGGGYVAGTALAGIPSLQRLASTHDCVVVTVDYRLAPETKFPGSLEDNYAALRWLHTNAHQLGVDPNRIALLGESAGGGHAAALAIAARDRGEFPIAAQVLIYPMIDDRTGSTRPTPAHIGAFVWNAQANRFGWSSLLGMPAGSASPPYGAVPARVDKLAGLPPTFIGTGAIDLFVEENIDYAQRLMQAGVATELYVAPGAYHGFDLIVPEAPVSKKFIAAWNDALGRMLRTR